MRLHWVGVSRQPVSDPSPSVATADHMLPVNGVCLLNSLDAAKRLVCRGDGGSGSSATDFRPCWQLCCEVDQNQSMQLQLQRRPTHRPLLTNWLRRRRGYRQKGCSRFLPAEVLIRSIMGGPVTCSLTVPMSEIDLPGVRPFCHLLADYRRWMHRHFPWAARPRFFSRSGAQPDGKPAGVASYFRIGAEKGFRRGWVTFSTPDLQRSPARHRKRCTG